MIQIRSRAERYKLSLPQTPKEIPAEYFAGVVDCINLPKHYAIIAIVRQVRFYDFLLTISNPKSKINATDVAILCKHNYETLPEGFAVGQQVVIDESAVARGNQIVAPCALSYENVVSYFVHEEKAVKANDPKDKNTLITKIMSGEAKDDKGVALKQYPICFISFKIVPVCDIHGTVDSKISFNDQFVEVVKEEETKEAKAETEEKAE